MQRLAYRPRIGHRATRLLLPGARLNSTLHITGAPEGDSAVSYSKSHIASKWGDIVIPSREEVLRDSQARKLIPSQNRAYGPDLGYLSKGPPASFASRLATKLTKNRVSTSDTQTEQRKTPQLATTRPALTSIQTKPREPRVDHTIAQRRAERLAREEARRSDGSMVQVQPPRKTQRPVGHQRQILLESSSDMFANPNPKASQRSRLSANRPSLNNRGQRTWQNSSNLSRRPGKRAGLVGKGGKSLGLDTASQRVKSAESEEDISMEILEEGCDFKKPAELTSPETPLTDLDAVFGRFLNTTSDITTSPLRVTLDAAFSTNRIQWVQETLGGDYNRFAPRTSDPYVIPHCNLGHLAHAKLVLSKRKDIVIGARHRALQIIDSSVGRVDVESTKQI